MVCGDKDMAAQKKLLRRSILKKRRALGEAVKREESRAIYRHLMQWGVFQKAKTLFCYLSMPDEVATLDIVRAALDAKKRVAVPLVTDVHGQMECALLKSCDDLECGAFGILAPRRENCALLSPAEIELVLAPGVAFTLDGKRLGMGAGFYDRMFARMARAVAAGLAFDCQIVESIPCEAHDWRLDYLAARGGVASTKQRPQDGGKTASREGGKNH